MSDRTMPLLPGELWRPVPGWEGLYAVSNLGRVWSNARGGRLLVQCPDKKGYLCVGLWANNTRKQRPVHRLVAAAFHGPRPDGQEVRHLDGDPSNNNLSNLAYGTGSENQLDRVRHGTHNNATKTHCIHGHEFTEENTAINHHGGKPFRVCRTCQKEWRRQHELRRKAQQSAVA